MKSLKRSFHIAAIAAATVMFSCENIEGGEKNNNVNEYVDPNKAEEYVTSQQRSPKRGLCAHFKFAGDIDLLAEGTSWFYNWGPDVRADIKSRVDQYDMTFYPMTWNDNYDANRIKAHKKAYPQCEYLLAFNEPNLSDQADMTPSVAASYWPALKALAAETGLKLISPAMNYGTMPGYHDPVKWLDEFLAQPGVSADDIHGIALHCYMPTAAALKGFVDMFDKYGKPIWMTEFCAWENHVTFDLQKEHMVATFTYMENEPKIVKYAWFMERSEGSMVKHPYFDLTTKTSNNELNELGLIYNYMSTFDKQTYYSRGQVIPAENYSSANLTSTGVGGVSVRRSTDATGILEVSNFVKENWVEYQIDVPTAGKYRLDVRYAAKRNAQWQITTAGGTVDVEIQATGEYFLWKTIGIVVDLAAGKQTVRINPVTGNSVLNWIRIDK